MKITVGFTIAGYKSTNHWFTRRYVNKTDVGHGAAGLRTARTLKSKQKQSWSRHGTAGRSA